MIITINEEDHRRAATFHAKRVEKIPGVGVNLDRFSPDVNTRSEWRKKLGLADDDIALLTVGELHKGKNQQTVIRAIRKINNPHIRYFLCGKGEEEANLKNLQSDVDLKNRCISSGIVGISQRSCVPVIYLLFYLCVKACRGH